MLEFVKSEKFYLPIVYIVVGLLIYNILSKMVASVSRIDIKHSKGMDKRKNTIIVLINSVIKYVVALIVLILILGVYGVNTTSLIASLGIATAIIGLAFQDTIKDFLAGVFLIFDNAYAVGDVVKINGFTGEVVALGLKATKIRAYTGEVMILSNSSFTEVINYSLNHSKVLVTIPIHYSTDIDMVEKIFRDIKTVIEKEDNVYCMDLLGIDSFDDSSIKYAFIVECVSMEHYGAKRKILGLIKKKFDEEGICIPYNQIDVHIDK